jgi:hypothetical protein
MSDDTIDLWALDEVHFQQQGSRCHMWVPPETKDPVVFHHPTRKSVGYFSAVRLRDGQFFFRRETARFNGETFWAFHKAFQEASAWPGRRVAAISDNASYHRSKLHRAWRDQQAGSFGLDFLPPYSPELNPPRRTASARGLHRLRPSRVGMHFRSCVGIARRTMLDQRQWNQEAWRPFAPAAGDGMRNSFSMNGCADTNPNRSRPAIRVRMSEGIIVCHSR